MIEGIREYVHHFVTGLMALFAALALWFRRRADQEGDRADEAEERAKRAKAREELYEKSEEVRKDNRDRSDDDVRDRLRDDYTRDSDG